MDMHVSQSIPASPTHPLAIILLRRLLKCIHVLWGGEASTDTLDSDPVSLTCLDLREGRDTSDCSLEEGAPRGIINPFLMIANGLIVFINEGLQLDDFLMDTVHIGADGRVYDLRVQVLG